MRRGLKFLGIADRYIFGEAFITYLVGLALFLAFLIVNQLFLEWESYSGALSNFKLIFILVGYRIPSYLTLSFPIALLFATLMSMGRFAKDNELTAMFTNGISLYRLMLPYMLLVIPNVILSFTVNETLVPWAAQQTIALKRAHPELMLSDDIQKDGPFITRLPFNRYLIAANFNKETGIIGNLLIDDLGGTKMDEQGNRIVKSAETEKYEPSGAVQVVEPEIKIEPDENNIIDLNKLQIPETPSPQKPSPPPIKGVEIIERPPNVRKQTEHPPKPERPIPRPPAQTQPPNANPTAPPRVITRTPDSTSARIERYNPNQILDEITPPERKIVRRREDAGEAKPQSELNNLQIKPTIKKIEKPLPWYQAAGKWILETLHIIKKKIEVSDASSLMPTQIEPISDSVEVVPERKGPRLLLAFNARIAEDRLLLINPWQYTMDKKGNLEEITKADAWRMDLGIPLSKLYSQIKSPEELTKEQLAEQVRQKRELGKNTDRDLTDLYLKYSVPFASLFLVLVGMPLSLKAPRDERMLGLILTYVLVFGYYLLYFIFRTMGYTGVVAPIIAAWGHNIIYTFLSIYIFATVRK